MQFMDIGGGVALSHGNSSEVATDASPRLAQKSAPIPHQSAFSFFLVSG